MGKSVTKDKKQWQQTSHKEFNVRFKIYVYNYF
jgi:hypothetical protein